MDRTGEDKMDIFSEIPYVDLGEDMELNDIIERKEEDIEEDRDAIFNDSTEEEINTNEEEIPESVIGQDDDAGEESTTDDSDVSSPSLFSSIAALLVEEGLMSPVDSKIEDKDTFVNLFKKEIEKNEYSDLNETQKKYLKALRDGLPEEEIVENIKVTSQLDSITDEHIKTDPELRQRIIYNDLINKGLDQAKAIKYLKRSIELGEDEEEAKEALESIKAFNQEKMNAKQQEIVKQKELEKATESKRIADITKRIEDSTEIIKGFTLTSNVKETMKDNMLKVVNTTEDGKEENALMKYARENKEDFDLKLYYLYTITKGFQDFDVIEKTKNTKIVKDLENAMRTTTRIRAGNTPTYLQDPESYTIDIAGHDLVLD